MISVSTVRGQAPGTVIVPAKSAAPPASVVNEPTRTWDASVPALFWSM
jgi:hypothetical protein